MEVELPTINSDTFHYQLAIGAGVPCSAEPHSASDATMADKAAMDFAESQLAIGHLPQTQALFGGRDPRDVLPELIGDRSERDRFRHGLSILLKGAAHRMNLDLPDHRAATDAQPAANTQTRQTPPR